MRRAIAALALALVFPLPVLAQVTIKPGETLSEIADRHGVSVNRLMQVNGIKDPTLVQIGQKLVIPGAGGTSRRPGSRSAGAAGRGRGPAGTVVVQPGDTLSEIADRHGVSLQRLLQLNAIRDPAMVEVGRRLVLGGGGGAGSGGGAGGSGSRTRAGGSYTVRSGETLGEIAERHNTSVNRLMQLNGITDPTQLQAGSALVVPGAGGSGANRTSSRRAGPSAGAGSREHVVQPGESLSEIADAYNLPIQKLVSLNNIGDPDLLMTGSRLKLTAPPPLPRSRPTARPAARPVVRPAMAAAAKPKPAARPAAELASKPKPTTAPAATSTNTATAAINKPASRPAPTATQGRDTAVSTATAVQTRPQAREAGVRVVASTREPAATTGTPTRTAAADPAPAGTPAPRAATALAAARPRSVGGATDGANAVAGATASGTAAPATGSATAARPASGTSAAQVALRQQEPKPRARTSQAATRPGPARPATPDWRTYGPLQVDWANWQPMGGSYVAPSLNAEGLPLYMAINCGARKLNATSQTGQWRLWEAPRTDAEQQLVKDLCRAKGS